MLANSINFGLTMRISSVLGLDPSSNLYIDISPVEQMYLFGVSACVSDLHSDATVVVLLLL